MSMLRGAVTLLGLRRGPAATLAVMLLTVVVGLVAAHLGRRTIGRPSHLAFGLAQETGYGEMFFSVLTVWATGLLAWAAVRWRQAVLGAWAGAFVLLLLDDRLMLHERAGGWIREHVAIVPDHPTGELVWLLCLAVVAGGAVLALHLWAAPDARAVSGVLVLLGGGLFATGVVLDLLHRFTDGGFPDALLTALEDGGEIAVMSLVVAFLFAVVADGHRPRPGRRLGLLMGVRPAPSHGAGEPGPRPETRAGLVAVVPGSGRQSASSQP